MKKHINIFLILFLGSNITFAQNKILNKHSFNLKNHSQELRETDAIVFKAGTELYYSWDSTNAGWIYWDSAFTLYNSIGDPTRRIEYNGGFNTKDSNIYNTSRYLIKKIHSFLNGVNWDTNFVETYTYNSQNQVTADQTISYSSGIINGEDITTNTYNNGQLATTIYQQLNNGTWLNLYKSNFFYPGNGAPDKLVNYNWDTLANVWQKTDSIINITFHLWNGNLDSSLVSSYIDATVSGQQILDSLFYDANNNQIKFIEYMKQGAIWVYNGLQTDAYLFDGNNSITQKIEMIYNQGNSSQTIANNGAKWVYSNFNSYSTTGILNTELNNTNILFPNPNTGIFHVTNTNHQISNIEIYNVIGEKVYSTNYFEQQTPIEINLSSCAKGIYFVKLVLSGSLGTGEKIKTKKIIVQ